jgi:parallel beta-helix repeat protein
MPLGASGNPSFLNIINLPVFDVRNPAYAGGAKGDGVTDDTAAINAAIAAASAAGGGIVLFPPGTFVVAPSGTGTYILIKSNVIVRGSGPATKLKIKNNCGDYRALFYDNGVAHTNFVVEDLTIDQNPTGNTNATVTTSAGQLQIAVFVTNGTGTRVQRCRFDPCCGVNTVDVNGTGCSDAKVEDCYFHFVPRGASPAPYDNSAVYVEADNYQVTDNTFEAAQGSGARGAIELHDSGGVCEGNVTNWYRTLVNVVSTTGVTQPNYTGHTISGNTANNCNDGIALWPITGTTLRGCTITGNTVNLAQKDHAQNTCMGIGVVWDNSVQGSVEGLTITGNTIVFQDEGGGRAVGTEYLNNGIRLAPVGGTSSGVTCDDNTILRSPGPAIRPSGTSAGTLLTRFNISNNVIVDAGQNAGITNSAYRTGIFMDGANMGVGVIEGNKFFDTGTSGLKGVNVAWIGSAPTAVAWRNNPQYTASSSRLQLVGFGIAGLTIGVNGVIDVKTDFGAKGDGAANDTTACQAALDAANTAGGGIVYFPAGTYLVDFLVFYSNVIVRGSGEVCTVLKKRVNDGNALLRSSSYASIGGSSAGGEVGWAIEDITLDGNKATASGTSGLQAYGYKYKIRNVTVRNCALRGVHLDWNGGQGFGADSLESSVYNLRVHDCDGVGLDFLGPHDARFADVVLFKNAVNLHVGPNATATQWVNLHCWGTVTDNAGAVIEAGYTQIANSAFEGANTNRSLLVLLGGSGVLTGVHCYGTDGNTSENATGIQLGQTGDTGYGGGTTAFSVLGAKQATGWSIRNAAFDHCGGTNGALWFLNEANNSISGRFFQNQGAYTNGTPSNSTSYQLEVNGLTATGVLSDSGGYKVGAKANQAFWVTDKAGSDKFNVNTNSGKVELPNNTKFFAYTSGYSTNTAFGLNHDGALTNGWSSSAGVFDTNTRRATGGLMGITNAIALGSLNQGATNSNGTISVTSAGVTFGQVRVTFAVNVTGLILQAGSTGGQEVTVVNESAFYGRFDVAATSNVADGTDDFIAPNSAAKFQWNAGNSRWHRMSPSGAAAVAFGGGAYRPNFKSGTILCPAGTSVTTSVPSVNELTACQVLVSEPCTITVIGCNVTVAAAGSFVRMGIYADNGHGYPGALVANSDTGQIDASTTGNKTFTYGTPLTLAPGVYWLAGVSQGGTPTVNINSGQGMGINAGNMNSALINNQTSYRQTAVSGALPATFTTTQDSTTYGYRVGATLG